MLQSGTYRSEWPVLLPWAMVTSESGLLLSDMSESVTLLQLGSKLMLMVTVITNGHVGPQVWSDT